MKVSDYIVKYLIGQGITDVFGYPGGMVTHLMESFSKYQSSIHAHVTYHEQGAAFSACGWAQVTGKPGVAYATSGPGATNLLTGVCNAYFDSIPVLFLTGQVNSFESKAETNLRQRGFQETDILSMAESVTKYAAYVDAPEKIRCVLDRAFYEMTHGRPGPVLLDIPMNIFRSEVDETRLEGFLPLSAEKEYRTAPIISLLEKALSTAQRPCLLLGNGIKIAGRQEKIKEIICALKIPVITSMIAFDIPAGSPFYYGFIGAYGHRAANFIAAKSDLVLCLGTRLDVRQVGAKRENFAPDARLIRFDIDSTELAYPVHENEEQYEADLDTVLAALEKVPAPSLPSWRAVCDELKEKLAGHDDRKPNRIVEEISRFVPSGTVITTDVGQNQVWVAQSFQLKAGQKVLFSGGHAAMGYSLPAAIGACIAAGRKPVICFNGDGGIQMNIQELQTVVREQLPVKIIILNNHSLGMIRHFQEMYFHSNFFQTRPEGGYTCPDFCAVGLAYGIRSSRTNGQLSSEDIAALSDDKPFLLEISISEDTYVFPKLEFGKPNQDQEPLLEREFYRELMQL